jgi:hypothetical protein
MFLDGFLWNGGLEMDLKEMEKMGQGYVVGE